MGIGTVQQQGFDQGLGAGLVAVAGLGRGPVPLVGAGEHPGLACLDEGGRAGQRPGLVGQHLEVVVQHQRDAAADRGAFVFGDQPGPVEHLHGGRPQQDPDLAADVTDRYRVLALPHRHPGVPVDPGAQADPGLERLGRQRPQQDLFGGEVVPDQGGALPDAAVIILRVAPGEVGVQLSQGLDLGHGDGVVAAEPASLALDPALLVGPFDTGPAVEHVEAVVGPERHPPVRLDPGTAHQHPGHGSLQVVVADVDRREATQLFERVPVPVEERLLRRGRIRAVDRLARVRQAEREQEHLGLHPGQHDPQVGEVDLGFRTRRMGLRHEHLRQLLAGLGGDPRPGVADIVTDRRVGDHQLVLLEQPHPDPQRRMTLLPRGGQVFAQHRVDQRLHRVQHRRHPLRHLPRRRFRRRQRLPDRAPVHPMPDRQLTDRHIRIIPTVPTDRFEHLDTTPTRHAGLPTTLDGQPVDQREVGPDQTVTTAPVCRTRGQIRPSRWGQIRLSFPLRYHSVNALF